MRNLLYLDRHHQLRTPLYLSYSISFVYSNIPVYFIWLKYLSWFFYTNEVLNINQWQYVDDIGCETNSTCLAVTGDQVLQRLDFNPVSYNRVNKCLSAAA